MRELAIRAAWIGIGATFALDLWNACLKHLFGVPSLNLAMLGRWIGHFPRGRFVHDNIGKAPPIRGELILGWMAHYAIGVTFAALLLSIWGIEWARRPTPLPALVIGLVTLAAPWLLMQPAMGMGIAASKTPNPNAARLKSLASHTVYGAGLYGSALLILLVLQP